MLCIPSHSSPSGRQREYRQPQALSSSLPQFPSFPPLQAGLFLLLHSLIPFLSKEHSLECKTLESNLPIAQIGKLRLRKIGTCSELYKLLAEPVKKVNSDCIGGVAGERLGAGPEWFPSLTAVTSQDNAGTKFSFWSSSCGDFFFSPRKIGRKTYTDLTPYPTYPWNHGLSRKKGRPGISPGPRVVFTSHLCSAAVWLRTVLGKE